MKTAKQRLSWDDYLYLINDLLRKIYQSKIKFKYCYGISRGGLIPVTIISHQLNIKMFDRDVFPKKYDNVLIVDDICDTGKTLKPFIDLNSKHIKTATIFKHILSPISPDFYVETNEKWIVFPYEKD